MGMYDTFAAVYDSFMEDVPADAWAQFLVEKLREHGIMDGLVLDLGCGTGKMTRRLRDYGYDMIGIDLSAQMLDQALSKEEKPGEEAGEKAPILYLNQDMRSFELYGTVRAVVSVCDCLNYMLCEEDLLTVFRLVNNYLDPGGLFLFDLYSPDFYEENLGEGTFAETAQDAAYIWDNHYDPESRINEYDLTFFLKGKEGLYERSSETHYERGYTIEEVRRLLKRAKLRSLDVFQDYTEEPFSGSGRGLYLAEEISKTRQGPFGIREEER